MLFQGFAEESSWVWTSGTILTAGLALYFAWQLVWLLRKRRPQMAEHWGVGCRLSCANHSIVSAAGSGSLLSTGITKEDLGNERVLGDEQS